MDGVSDLLSTNEKGNFDLVITPASNIGDLMQEIERLNPNIIIMEEFSSSITPVDLITSVVGNQKIRVVVLNSRDTKMDVYEKREFTVSNIDHFIETLNHEIP
jgi:hypothetical protein